MAAIRLLLGFTKYSDDNLSSKALLIVSNLEGNPNITVTVPTVGVLREKTQIYNELLVQSATGDLSKKALKNEAKKELIKVLQDIGRYINALYFDNKPVLLSTGYDISSENNDSYTLGEVESFKITNGKKMGELVSSCNGVKNRTNYFHQYTDEVPTPETKWKSIQSTTPKVIIKGLEASRLYHFRIVVTGKGDQEIATDPIKVYAQ